MNAGSADRAGTTDVEAGRELGCQPGQPSFPQVHQPLSQAQEEPFGHVTSPLKRLEVVGRTLLVIEKLQNPGQAAVMRFELRNLSLRRQPGIHGLLSGGSTLLRLGALNREHPRSLAGDQRGIAMAGRLIRESLRL